MDTTGTFLSWVTWSLFSASHISTQVFRWFPAAERDLVVVQTPVLSSVDSGSLWRCWSPWFRTGQQGAPDSGQDGYHSCEHWPFFFALQFNLSHEGEMSCSFPLKIAAVEVGGGAVTGWAAVAGLGCVPQQLSAFLTLQCLGWLRNEFSLPPGPSSSLGFALRRIEFLGPVASPCQAATGPASGRWIAPGGCREGSRWGHQSVPGCYEKRWESWFQFFILC